MRKKIQIIFIPTAIALIGLLIIYTGLHWVLFIKFDLPIKEIITNFGIPCVLTGLTVWIFIRPRCKILDLEVKRGNWGNFYSFILWVILTIPLIVAQEYIVTASGRLTELHSIDEISKLQQTKYYTLKNYYFVKNDIGVYSAFDVSGKHNTSLNMHLYIAMPIFEKASDTTNWECQAWLGIDYRETISNRLDPKEKQEKYRLFAMRSQRDFECKNLSEFEYLDRIGNSDKRVGFSKAAKNSKTFGPYEIILLPVNEPFVNRNGNKLAWLLGSSLVGSMLWFIMLAIPKIDEGQLKRVMEGRPDRAAQRELRDVIGLLKPTEGYFITPILIYTNLGLYLLMTFAGLGFVSFQGRDLLSWGANYRPLVIAGEWWRLFISIFLHGGLMHVLANMYGLLFVGIFLEPLLGRKRYLTAYLLTGVLASIASIWWYDATISVGASGAIFGLYGIFLALMLTKIFPPGFGKAFLLSTLIFVGYNLLMGIFGGIDNAAHIGGLLSGFLLGFIFYPTLKQQLADQEADNISRH